MGDEKKLGWMNQLWKWKFVIILGLAVAALAYTTYYYHAQSEDRAADLSQKSADFDALNMDYLNLTNEHLELQASHENLTERYTNLSYNFSALSTNTSSLRSDYDSLKSTVTSFQEKGGPQIALYYRSYHGGTKDAPKFYVQAIVYNVGDNKASRVTVHCRVIYMGQPDLNDQTFTDIAPLDKRNCTWEFDPMTQLDAVWVEAS